MKNYLIVGMLFLLLAGAAFAECPKADLNGDCKVNLEDYAIMAEEWLTSGSFSVPTYYPSQTATEDGSALHITVEGQSQGIIKGNCTAQGWVDSIVGVSYDHSCTVPRDPQTGLPTGSLIHNPLTIKKYTDISSPKLIQAMCTGEQLNVELKLLRTTYNGYEHYYTIRLENAIIVDYKTSSLNLEEISFTYGKIIWTWEPDGIVVEQSWKSPAS